MGLKTNMMMGNTLTSSNRKIRAFTFLGFSAIAAILIFWNVILAYLMIDKLHMNDFGKFFYSIVAYLEGGEMYGPNPATFVVLNSLFGQQFWNLNPPHFHLPLLPLGLLSPKVALTIWMALNLICLVASVHLIGKELDWTPTSWQSRFLFLGLLAFCGTGAFFVTGQLSFLLLFPLTIGWIQARNSHWAKAGIFLGLACAIKPFLLIFIPYLLIKKKFLALSNLTLICTFAYSVGLIAFGQQIYWQWIEKLLLVDWSWASMNASVLGLFSRTFQENPSYTPILDSSNIVRLLWFIFSGLIASITFYVLYKDHSKHSIDRAFAFLIIAAILISPLGWIYYLFFPIGPLTAIIYQGVKSRASFNDPASLPLIKTRNRLVVFATVGYLIPLQVLQIFQPAVWATFTIGSIYCWCTLAVWMSLLLDWQIGTTSNQECTSTEQITPNSMLDLNPRMVRM